MSLSYRFQLTPAQTGVLLDIAHYRDGDKRRHHQFVPIVDRLMKKGLVEHRAVLTEDGFVSMEVSPYCPTPQGAAIADLIVQEAREIVESAEGTEVRRAAAESRRRTLAERYARKQRSA